jgi:GntR family transcriptional regulator/MocR family aminotransferase
MSEVALHLDGRGALHAQCYRALREAIEAGRLPPNGRLPPSRRLAEGLGVSRPVVVRAYDQLQAEGYLEARVGSGTYVAGELPERLLRASPRPGSTPPRELRWDGIVRDGGGEPLDVVQPPVRPERGVVDFRYGAPAREFPLSVWRRLIAAQLRTPKRELLSYGDAAGYAPLRRALARHLSQYRAVRCSWQQVVIVGGSQQALSLSARLLLGRHTTALLEDPHYQGARHVFAAAGAQLVGVAVGDEGLEVDQMPPPERGVRLVYVTPSHQFPTGTILPVARRLRLLEWAARADAYIIEDDYDSEFRYDAQPLPAMQGLDRAGRVIYMGTFSKVMFPALRIAYAVLPEHMVAAFVSAKWLADRQCATLEQAALADFISDGHLVRHLRRARRAIARRRQVLLEEVQRQLGKGVQVGGVSAGLHAVLWLDGFTEQDVAGLVERAHEAGVNVYSIAPYFLGTPARAGLVIGYGHLSESTIRNGIRRIAAALAAVRD